MRTRWFLLCAVVMMALPPILNASETAATAPETDVRGELGPVIDNGVVTRASLVDATCLPVSGDVPIHPIEGLPRRVDPVNALTLADLASTSQDRDFVAKDPLLAAALSYYVPGLGQFYAGSYFKGIAFWIVEQALFVSTLITIAEIDIDVTGNLSLGLDIKSRDDTSKGERTTAWVLAGTLVNIIDAVNTTRNYNLQRDRGIYADFGYREDTRAYSIGLNTRF
jgi:hypothetical protein